MTKTRAVVWDLDGVIVDSAQAHNASWAEMARRFGVAYDPNKDFKGIFGRHNNDIIRSMWGVNDQAEVDRMADAKEEFFRQEAANLKPLPGVLQLMSGLREHGWKQAVGSSAPMQNIKMLLAATGVGDYMEAISSGDDVSVGKPDPQVFLLAFQRLGIEPQNGVVIEDAPAGVQAARRAGAACLAVTSTQTTTALLEAGADQVVKSLGEITAADLERLVAQKTGDPRRLLHD